MTPPHALGGSASARWLAALLLAVPLALFALPLLLALPLALAQAADVGAWRSLSADPQLPRALALSVASALVSTGLALAACLTLITHLHGTPLWQHLSRALVPMLALPHAAFAIGLALLVMPAGLLARLLAPLAGWSAPPDWATVNDPQGVGLTAVLFGKELPFLLWNAVALLNRPDVAASMRGWLASGATLGYCRAAVWWRVLWPLLLPRLAWPLLAVLAYSLTVVDLALIVGPASPPTLAVIAWQGLQHGDAARNAEGAAAATLLGAVLLVLVLALALAYRIAQRLWQRVALDGHRHRRTLLVDAAARGLLRGLLGLYAVVALLLLASSFVGVWTFPSLLPQAWAGQAWMQVRDSSAVLGVSAGLATFAALASLALVLCWFEATPVAWDARVMPLVLAPLVVPALLLLLLVRWVGDRVEPGFGVAAAVTLGLGTLIMPFATQFFGHVLAALLGFCAFALLWHERDGPPRPWLVAGAGIASGLAVTTEYPLALGGAILGVYAVSRGDVIRRGLAYAAGVAAGVAPLVAYNVWAFGSVTTFSYANAVDEQGLSGHATLGLNGGGFFGIGWPSPKVALELLFAPRGLLALTPVVALAAVGTVLLARRGRRAEAWVIGAVCAAYLTYDSGYWLPFGGGSPGPRFLIPMLPFLAVGLAAAYRRLPAVTLALAIPSALIMLAADLTKPLIGSDDVGVWARLVAQGDFEHTVLSALGAGNGWLALAPVLGAAGLAVGLAVRATPPVALAGGLRAAALTVVGWALVAAVAPWALGHDAAVRGNWSALWLIVGAGAASLVVLGALAVRGRRRPVVDDAGTRAPAGARPAARAPQPEAARSR